MILETTAAMLGTLSFAILFHAPQNYYVHCAFTGALGWIVYRTGTDNSLSFAVASLLATFVLTVLSRWLSVVKKAPATIFLVTGIFPLVPGAGIYYTAYYVITGNVANATFKGVETFKIAGAIVLGIIFGFFLPQVWFNAGGRLYERVKYIRK